MIARHIGNVETEIGLDHWPNIYCGVAVFLLFLLYLGCRQISLKEKAVYSGMLLMFYASFSVNVLNFIWHGFHYPNSLPCRQSFIYIFLMLVICYRAYVHLREMPIRHLSAAFFASAGFVILAEKLGYGRALPFCGILCGADLPGCLRRADVAVYEAARRQKYPDFDDAGPGIHRISGKYGSYVR